MRPQHSALLSTLTPQENRNPVLTEMYWPSGGANIASIMASASGSVYVSESIWTTPYFDTGGGEIWIITRSVPVRDAEGIIAIITTDLPVDAPIR